MAGESLYRRKNCREILIVDNPRELPGERDTRFAADPGCFGKLCLNGKDIRLPGPAPPAEPRFVADGVASREDSGADAFDRVRV